MKKILLIGLLTASTAMAGTPNRAACEAYIRGTGVLQAYGPMRATVEQNGVQRVAENVEIINALRATITQSDQTTWGRHSVNGTTGEADFQALQNRLNRRANRDSRRDCHGIGAMQHISERARGDGRYDSASSIVGFDESKYYTCARTIKRKTETRLPRLVRDVRINWDADGGPVVEVCTYFNVLTQPRGMVDALRFHRRNQGVNSAYVCSSANLFDHSDIHGRNFEESLNADTTHAFLRRNGQGEKQPYQMTAVEYIRHYVSRDHDYAACASEDLDPMIRELALNAHIMNEDETPVTAPAVPSNPPSTGAGENNGEH